MSFASFDAANISVLRNVKNIFFVERMTVKNTKLFTHPKNLFFQEYCLQITGLIFFLFQRKTMSNINTILPLKNMVFFSAMMQKERFSWLQDSQVKDFEKQLKLRSDFLKVLSQHRRTLRLMNMESAYDRFLTVYMPYTVMEIYDCNTASCKSSDFSVYDRLRPCLLDLGINTNIILGGIETAYLLFDPDTNPKYRVFISEDQQSTVNWYRWCWRQFILPFFSK